MLVIHCISYGLHATPSLSGGDTRSVKDLWSASTLVFADTSLSFLLEVFLLLKKWLISFRAADTFTSTGWWLCDSMYTSRAVVRKGLLPFLSIGATVQTSIQDLCRPHTLLFPHFPAEGTANPVRLVRGGAQVLIAPNVLS